MKTRFGASAVLACSLGAGLLAHPAAAHVAAQRAPARTAHLLAAKATSGDVVTTDRGLTFAMWSTGLHTRLEWAVKRPGQPWTKPQVKASWPVTYVTHGQPVLTTSSNHRVTAAWLDRRRRVVVEDWSPRSGWGKPAHLSNALHVAEDLTIASNRTGDVAVSWGSAALGGGSQPLKAVVGVRRGSDWLVHTVGRKAASSGDPKGPMALGLDDAGDVTVAWENVQSGSGPALVARLKADSSTWDHRQKLGFVDEYFNLPPVGLAVQPDGAEMVNPEEDFPEDTGVFTRVGDGAWTSVGDQPFVTDSLSTPDGALVTFGGFPIYEDPDGIAGPLPFASLGGPDFPRLAFRSQVFLASDGSLVAVSRAHHKLVSASLPPGGTWSAASTALTFDRTPDYWASSMSGDGRVTVLLGSKSRAFEGLHQPTRLEAVTFDATP